MNEDCLFLWGNCKGQNFGSILHHLFLIFLAPEWMQLQLPGQNLRVFESKPSSQQTDFGFNWLPGIGVIWRLITPFELWIWDLILNIDTIYYFSSPFWIMVYPFRISFYHFGPPSNLFETFLVPPSIQLLHFAFWSPSLLFLSTE